MASDRSSKHHFGVLIQVPVINQQNSCAQLFVDDKYPVLSDATGSNTGNVMMNRHRTGHQLPADRN